MSKTYFGWEGKYEIYNENCIIQQKFNENKELTDKYKIFNQVNSIPNLEDKISLRKIIDYEFKNRVRL